MPPLKVSRGTQRRQAYEYGCTNATHLSYVYVRIKPNNEEHKLHTPMRPPEGLSSSETRGARQGRRVVAKEVFLSPKRDIPVS